jgi:hypothetical protein
MLATLYVILMLMDQQQIPQAPPPYQPVTPRHNPYEFITNPGPPPKKSLLPKVNSKKQRLIIAVAGAVVLLLIGLILLSLLNSGSAALKADYLKLLQQQTELIRVSDVGATKAKQSEAKNLAITAKLTLTSQQIETLKLAKSAGAETNPKFLTLGKNAQTDTQLTTAEQANQFDVTFVKTMLEGLQAYQQTLKKVQDASDANTKATLSTYYSAVSSLIGPPPQ